MSEHSEWPPALQAALESPTLERRGWARSLAPQMIGLFLWVAFFDQFPRETLGAGGVIWPFLGAGLGGLLSYLLLYRSPALWGYSTGRPLGVIATSTFGVNGATWVPGLLLAGAAVVWLAVSTDYATALILRGLVLIRLLAPSYLQPIRVGHSLTPGVLFLVTSLLWCYAAAFTGRYLVRVIAALMNVFPVVPAVILGLTSVLAFRGLRGHPPAALEPAECGRSVAFAVQMVFGFFATAGLSSADWGTAARDAKDVKTGGWVGVAVASWVVATLALLTVFGAPGVPGRTAGTLSYTAALESLVGGRTAGAMLLLLGLAALAPACYASFVSAVRLNDTWPRVSRTKWTILAAGLAWLLLSGGWVGRLFDVFSVLGGLLAPAAGALAADYVRSRGVWPGPRSGYNAPGMLAWALGSIVGLAPLIGRAAGVSRLASVEPAAVFGFALAFVVFWLAASLGLGSAIDGRLTSPPTGS